MNPILKLKEFQAQLRTLTPREIDREVVRVVVANEKLVLDLVKNQILQGKDGNNKQIGTYRNKSYAKYKKRINPRAGGRVDLKLTGQFHDSFYLRSEPVLRVWARDLKVDPLVRKYGSSFFKLSPQSRRTLANKIAPQVLRRLRSKIGLRNNRT